MITPAAMRRFCSSRKTSSPRRFGMSRSSTTTSGRCASICASAVSPSAASATTVSSGSAASTSRNPLRSSGWSSATRTEITRGSLYLECQRDRGPRSGRRPDLGASAEKPDPLHDSGQAEAAASARLPRREPGAVVSHGDRDPLRRSPDDDARLRCACVLEDVAQALLYDAVDVDLALGGEDPVDRVDVRGDREGRRVADSADERTERFRQPEPVEVVGPQVPRDLPHLRDRVRRLVGDLAHAIGAVRQQGQISDDHEPLPETVVEFGGDAAALGFLRLDELARKCLLGRVGPLEDLLPPLHEDETQPDRSDSDERAEPPSLVEGREDDDAERPAFHVPNAVAVRGGDRQDIASGPELRVVRDARGAGVDPLVVVTGELVPESRLLRPDERVGG